MCSGLTAFSAIRKGHALCPYRRHAHDRGTRRLGFMGLEIAKAITGSTIVAPTFRLRSVRQRSCAVRPPASIRGRRGAQGRDGERRRGRCRD